MIRYILRKSKYIMSLWRISLLSWFIALAFFSFDSMLPFNTMLIDIVGIVAILFSAYCAFLGTAIRGLVAEYSQFVTWQKRPLDLRGVLSIWIIFISGFVLFYNIMISPDSINVLTIWLFASGYSTFFLRFIDQGQNLSKHYPFKRRIMHKYIYKQLLDLEDVLLIKVEQERETPERN